MTHTLRSAFLRSSLALTLLYVVFQSVGMCQAGTTTVQAVVLDPAGNVYTNCTVTANFVPSPTQTQQPTIGGQPFPTTIPVLRCDSFGKFTVIVADNSMVVDGHTSPPASMWRFGICWSDGITCFSDTLTISGSTQDISASLQSVAAPLPLPKNVGVPNTTLPFQAVPTFNTVNNVSYTMALSGNVTSINVTGPPNNGNILTLNLCEDATGGYTVNFPANFVLPQNYAFKTDANACNYLAFKFDGTDWQPWDNFGGSGTANTVSTALTNNYLPKANGPNSIINSSISDDGTTVSTPEDFSAGSLAGANLISGNCVQASGGGKLVTIVGGCGTSTGSVTVTGSPASGQGTIFSGPTSVTNGAFSDNGTTFSIGETASFKGPAPWVDVTAYGARTVYTPPQTTATISATSNSATVASASNFQKGDGVSILGAGANNSLSTPSAPTVTPSLASGPTGLGYDVAGNAGSTSYAYEIIACDNAKGCTAASSAGSTSAGAAALGTTTINLTSEARSGNVVTVTCAATCPVAVGANFYLSANNSLSDTSFVGFFKVATVTDSTHFTFTSGLNTLAGATTSATGGTIVYYATNHLTWTWASGVWKYYIYGPNCPGTCNLIGQSLAAQATGSTGFWDDFGTTWTTGMTDPLWVPSTAPASATNDVLATYITNISGTTFTLNDAATNSVTSAVFIFDDTPTVNLAAAAARGSGSQPSVLYFPPVAIPPATVQAYFFFSRWTPPNSTVKLGIIQAAPMNFADTANVPAGTTWTCPLMGTSVSTANFSQNGACVVGGSASPILYVNGGGTNFDHISVQGGSQNQQNLILGDAITNFTFNRGGLFTGTGSGNDHLGIGAIFRGDFKFTFENDTFSGDNLNATATTLTPALAFLGRSADNSSTASDIFMKDNWFVARGATIVTGTTGVMKITMFSTSTQSLNNPMLMIGQTSGCISGPVYIEGVVAADYPTSLLANWGSCSLQGPILVGVSLNAQPGSTVTGNMIPDLEFSGQQPYHVGQNYAMRISNTGPTMIDGFIAPTGYASLGDFNLKEQGHISSGNEFFFDQPPMAAPSATVASGGTLTIGSYTYQIGPVFYDGGVGALSLPSVSCTTTSGNQTCNLTWSAVTGAVTYMVYRNGTSPTGLVTVYPGVSGTSYSDNGSAFYSSGQPTVAGDGPVSLNNAQIVTPKLVLTGVTGTQCLHAVSGVVSGTGSDCGSGGGGGATLQTNGTNNASQTLLNFVNPATFQGLTFTWSNPSGGNETFALGGTLGNAGITNPNITIAGTSVALGASTSSFPSPGPIGGGTPGSAVFTTLQANSTVSGAGFTSLFASPPALGGTTPAAVTGTTITANTSLSINGGTALTTTNQSGTGSLCLTTNCAMTTPNLGTPSAVNLTNGTALPLTGIGGETDGDIIFGQSGVWTKGTALPNGITCTTQTTGDATSKCATDAFVIANSSIPVLPTAPNGIPQNITSTPSSGVGQPPAWSIPGVGIDAQTGTSYTIPITDDVHFVTGSNSSATAWTGFALANNYAFSFENLGSGLITYTPASGTVNGNATQIIPQYWFGFHYTDNTNTFMPVVPTIQAFADCNGTGKAETFTAATGGFGCNTITASAAAGGSNTQVQYNNSTALGGITNFTSNGTNVFLTAISAPSTPSSGFDVLYEDSTDLRFHDKNASGTIGTTAVAKAAVSHDFFTAMSVAGVFTAAQPACGDLSDSSGGCSMSTTAGGDLSGTLPSPTVVKINGGSVPASAAVLGSNSSSQPVAATPHGVVTPLQCADSSGSGTVQSCTTTPSFAPAKGDAILYNTTTANTGALTVNVNSSGAAAVQKWQGSALSSGDIKANIPVVLLFDGTNWQLQNLGNAPAGAVASVSNVDGTLTISPTSGAVVASIALGHANTWTALQTFGSNASIASTAHGVLLSENTAAAVATGAGTAGQIMTSGGSSADGAYKDFPDTKNYPAAICVSSTGASGWSTTLTAACAGESNNVGGWLPFADASTAQFTVHLPADWDTGTEPYINLVFDTATNTTGTMIFEVQTACVKNDGSTTDNPTFATAQVFSTVTAAAANRIWSENLQFNAVTSGNSCVANGTMLVKITRNTDTASAVVGVTEADITIPRLLTVQAN